MTPKEKLIKRIEDEINKTPTSELRNLLCDINILIQTTRIKKPKSFLHNHPFTETKLQLGKYHVIVDKDDWEEFHKDQAKL